MAHTVQVIGVEVGFQLSSIFDRKGRFEMGRILPFSPGFWRMEVTVASFSDCRMS